MGEGVKGRRAGGAVEDGTESRPRPLGRLRVDDRIPAEKHLLRGQPQGLNGPQKAFRVRLGGLDLISAGDGGNQMVRPLGREHRAQYRAALGADHPGGNPLGIQGLQQLQRAGEQAGGRYLKGVGLLLVQPAKLRLPGGVPVSGQEGIAVLQPVSHRQAHRLPLWNGAPHLPKGVLKARHNGLGGVPKGVVKVKEHSAPIHQNPS